MAVLENLKMLDKVNSPEDVKKLSIEEMKELAEDVRKGILNKTNTVGGHVGPDLGVVEATIAMHYVFNSPQDKFVFDISHQTYPHKMLTGRKSLFLDPLNSDITSFSNHLESEHDHFIIGHTSTSVSLATGLAKARDLKGEKGNVIALIGDGALSGGEAYEGLNNASVLGSNFIVLFNDNEMSIAENHGGLYKNLQALRESNGECTNNFFKTFGFDYIYVEEGNDIETLIKTFEKIKDIDHPIVVHLHTLKGKGYKPAEENKERFHWTMPNFMDTEDSSNVVVEDYNTITKKYLEEKIKKDPTVSVVNAGTPGVFGFDAEFRNKLGKNYTDVGIAEEHAVAQVSGMARNGAKPIFCVMSSFVQRTYDQLSQDLAINSNPATILVYWGGISPADKTHLCTFDIPLISNIPNIVYLAPTTKEEYLAMLDWSVDQTEHPVVIRVPQSFVSSCIEDKTDYSKLNKYEITKSGEKVAILGVGTFYNLGKTLQKAFKDELNIDATLINPKFITGIDKDTLDSLKANHDCVITLEDGALDGGFGEKIARYYSNSSMKVLTYGSFKEFTESVPLDKLYERYHLTPSLIIKDYKAL